MGFRVVGCELFHSVALSASGSGDAQFLVVILRVEEGRTLEFPQVEALPMVDEFLQRLVDQFPLGLYSAQFLCLPNKFGIKLDTGSHFYTFQSVFYVFVSGAV